MKNTKIVMISVLVIFIVVISLIFVYTKNRKVQITYAITPDIVSRLQAYPYNFGEPLENRGFNETDKDNPDMHKRIYDIFFEKIVTFDENARFFTAENLTYCTERYDFVIRGVLQIALPDGTVEEQDMEFAFNNSAPFGEESQFRFVGEKELSNKIIVKRGE